MKTACLFVAGALAFVALSHPAKAAVIFSENFGNTVDGTPLTSVTGTNNGTVGAGTGNTAFRYVRASTDANSLLEIQNPSSFSGSSGLILATGDSLAGIGSTGFTAFNTGTLSFSLRMPAALAGANDSLFFGLGSGATFTGNTTYTRSDLAFAYQINNGNFQEIQNTTTPSIATLGTAQKYDIAVQFSRFAIPDSNGIVLFAAGASRVYINGTQVYSGWATNSSHDITGFRFYSINGSATGGGYEIDNLLLQDTILLVPEPATVTLGALGFVALFLVLRRPRTS